MSGVWPKVRLSTLKHRFGGSWRQMPSFDFAFQIQEPDKTTFGAGLAAILEVAFHNPARLCCLSFLEPVSRHSPSAVDAGDA